MSKKLIITISLVITFLFMGSSVYSATILSSPRGGTGTTTKPTADQILVGGDTVNRYDVKTLTAGSNITFATTTDGLFTISSSGGGAVADWVKETNYGVLTLTASTTIPYWAKDAIYASSTLQVANDICTSSDRCSKIWLTDLDAITGTIGTLTISTVVSGNTDFGGYNLTNAGTLTFTSFSATSTTATSTITGGLAIETNGLVYDYSSNDFWVDTNTLYVDSSANSVGIGTTTPQKILGYTETGVVLNLDSSTTNARLVISGSSGGLEIINQNGVIDERWFNIDHSGAAGKVSFRTINDAGSAVGYNFLTFDTGNDKVGVGTTTPNSLLTVDGSFAVGTNGAEFTINSSGVVGAGTWNGTAIDFSSYTNATAGTGITFTGDSIAADLGTTIVSGEITDDTILNADINSSAAIAYSKLNLTNLLLEADLKAVDSAADEECLTYESTTGDFEWQACGGGVYTADGTVRTTTNTATTTAKSVSFSSGTLTTNSILRISALLDGTPGDSTQHFGVVVGNGTATTTIAYTDNDWGDGVDDKGDLVATLYINNSFTAWSFTSRILSGSTIIDRIAGTRTIDLSGLVIVDFTYRKSGTATNAIYRGVSIEHLTE